MSVAYGHQYVRILNTIPNLHNNLVSQYCTSFRNYFSRLQLGLPNINICIELKSGLLEKNLIHFRLYPNERATPQGVLYPNATETIYFVGSPSETSPGDLKYF